MNKMGKKENNSAFKCMKLENKLSFLHLVIYSTLFLLEEHHLPDSSIGRV
jgi:hypothetical protein